MFGITSFSQAPFSGDGEEVITVAVTGVAGISSLGSVSISASANVYPSGIAATGYIGSPNVWSIIDTNQTPNWQTTSTSQTPNWLPIAA
ncbi:MAG: hypothetical protein JW384_02652 [Nitrosomonadaceae bacterium]|nr:hypothetical protein [Nitrosomonadaceae bacterium]